MLWDIALSAWIIQDGNYGDFKAGEIARFAIEFEFSGGELDFTPVGRPIYCKPLGGAAYDVVAQTAYQSKEINVLDIGGLRVYQQPSMNVPRAGLRFKAKLRLGVDPFPYFEALAKIPGVPPLIYSWRIESILLGGHALPQTDAWNDHDSNAEYILRCELLEGEPTHEIG